MGGFKDLFITFALLGVFALAMFSFGVEISINNNSNNSLGNEPSMKNLNSSLISDLSSFNSKANSSKSNFESESPTSGFGELIIFSIISAGKVFTGMIFGIFNGLFLPLSQVIGISVVVLGVIASILTISLIIYAWRVYKSGE